MIQTSVPFCRLVWVVILANFWHATVVGVFLVGVDHWGIEIQSTTLSPEAEFFFGKPF